MKWGTRGSGNGQFESPWGIAITQSGTILVSDLNRSTIQAFAPDTTWLYQWGAAGSNADGLMLGPNDLTLDQYDHVYVADSENDQVQVFTASGDFLLRWGMAGSGIGEFNRPGAVAVDGDGNIYVSDNENNRVQEFGTTPTAATSTSWGRIKADYR
jgi:DNA-binding beta-propeller fold protein YncE